jgi:hypothetical protein
MAALLVFAVSVPPRRLEYAAVLIAAILVWLVVTGRRDHVPHPPRRALGRRRSRR